MTTPACLYLAQPASDLGTTNAVVTNVLTTCNLTTHKLETNVLTATNLEVERVDGVALNAPAATTLAFTGDGSEDSPLGTNLIHPLSQSASTPIVDYSPGLFWNATTFGGPPPFTAYSANDVQKHLSNAPLRELVVSIFTHTLAVPVGANMYFTAYDITGTTVFPNTSATPAASTLVDIGAVGNYGLMRYPLVDPIPAGTPITISLTADMASATGIRVMLYGVE